jgi:RNA-directed DNA polymerase
MHEGAHPRPVIEGVSFLGFVVFPDRRRLKRRKGIHFQRRLARLISDHVEHRLPLSEISATVAGWVNHTRFGNTIGLRKAVLRRAVIGPARERLEERPRGRGGAV